MQSNKFFSALLVLLTAILCEMLCKNLFGWSPDFALAALLVFSFYLGFFELLFLGSSAAILLNWTPVISFEIAALVALPLAVWWAKQLLPWRSEMSWLVFVIAGLAIFYGASNTPQFISNTGFIAQAIASSTLFAGVLFYLFHYVYGTQS